VNLLKPYHEGHSQLDPIVLSIPADVLAQLSVDKELECPAPTSLPSTVPVVDILLSKTYEQLTPNQTEDLTTLLKEFQDVFLMYPVEPLSGCTTSN